MKWCSLPSSYSLINLTLTLHNSTTMQSERILPASIPTSQEKGKSYSSNERIRVLLLFGATELCQDLTNITDPLPRKKKKKYTDTMFCIYSQGVKGSRQPDPWTMWSETKCSILQMKIPGCREWSPRSHSRVANEKQPHTDPLTSSIKANVIFVA